MLACSQGLTPWGCYHTIIFKGNYSCQSPDKDSCRKIMKIFL